MFGFNNHFGAELGVFDFHINRTDLLYLFAPFLSQLLQPPQTSHIAFAPRRHALVQPFGFFFYFFVKIFLLDNFLINALLLPFFKEFKTPVVAPHNSPVQPESGLRHIAEKHAVMADDNNRAAKIFDNFFQLFNRRHIQMVGRLVQQQNIGFSDQSLGQCGFFPLAAGTAVRGLPVANVKLFNQNVSFELLMFFVFAQTGKNHVAQSFVGRKIRVLRHIRNFCSRLNENFAVVGLDIAGNHFQQSRFAAAVPPHQADFVAAIDI